MLQLAVFYLLRRRFVIFDEMDSALSSEDFASAVSAYLDNGRDVGRCSASWKETQDRRRCAP